MKTAVKNSMEQKGRDSAASSAELQNTEVKACTKCKEKKSNKEFDKTKAGLQSWCKKCKRESKRKTDRAFISDLVPAGYIYCSSCNKLKALNYDNFHKSKLSENSKSILCKKCKNKLNVESARKNKDATRERHKMWRVKNKDHVKENSKKWKFQNKEKVRESCKKYMKEGGREKRRDYERKYYKENREKMISISCAYNSRVRKAKPKWQSQREINKFYIEAKLKNMEVDHIIPINSDLVCGLHCIDNFQLLTRQENASKGNRFWPDMP